jgi:hypothetical protein
MECIQREKRVKRYGTYELTPINMSMAFIQNDPTTGKNWKMREEMSIQRRNKAVHFNANKTCFR